MRNFPDPPRYLDSQQVADLQDREECREALAIINAHVADLPFPSSPQSDLPPESMGTLELLLRATMRLQRSISNACMDCNTDLAMLNVAAKALVLKLSVHLAVCQGVTRRSA